VIDVHTYRPRRKELLGKELAFAQHVMVDTPTNAAARCFLPVRGGVALLNYLRSRLRAEAIRCDRYTLVRSSGIVRHSTTDFVDARNAFALRHGIFTVLLEGRRYSPEDPPVFQNVRSALCRALHHVVVWAADDSFRTRKSSMLEGVPLISRYVSRGYSASLDMLLTTDNTIQKAKLPGNYLPVVRTTLRVRPPAAYGVPQQLTDLLQVLERHHFQHALPKKSPRLGSAYHLVETSNVVTGTKAKPAIYLKSGKFDLDEFVLFPVKQPGGHMLSLMLEPQSQYGLHRYPFLGLSLQPDTTYPIIRLS
jgi:hypothetical protein